MDAAAPPPPPPVRGRLVSPFSVLKHKESSANTQQDRVCTTVITVWYTNLWGTRRCSVRLMDAVCCGWMEVIGRRIEGRRRPHCMEVQACGRAAISTDPKLCRNPWRDYSSRRQSRISQNRREFEVHALLSRRYMDARSRYGRGSVSLRLWTP